MSKKPTMREALEKVPAKSYDYGDVPAHVVPVLFGGERVDLVIRSPSRVLAIVQADSGGGVGAEHQFARLLQEVWPKRGEIPDDIDAAFEWLFVRGGLLDMQVATERVTVRLAGLFPDPAEVAARVATFPRP